MSSLYHLYYASGAVDGVRNTDLYSGWCMHNHDNFGWWSVNLGILVDVYAVVITSRGKCGVHCAGCIKKANRTLECSRTLVIYSRFQLAFEKSLRMFVCKGLFIWVRSYLGSR